MGYEEYGSYLFWRIVIFLAIVGMIATISGFIYLIIWLVKHLRIV